MAPKLRVEERIERGARLCHAFPALAGLTHGESEPLPADRAHRDALRRIGRDKSRLWQETLPLAAELDEVLAIRSIAVQQHDQLRWSAGAWRKARSVEQG